MKFVKKLTALFLAIVMTMAMGITAFADNGGYTITINNDKSGYTYVAYQVFAGSVDADGVIGDVVWGKDIDSAKFLAALKADDTFKKNGKNLFEDCTTAAAVAEVISGDDFKQTTSGDKVTDSDLLVKFADLAGRNLKTDATGTASAAGTGNYTISGLDGGYYIVKNTVAPSGDSLSRYLIQVVKNTSITPKTETPDIDKNIVDEDANKALDYNKDNETSKVTGKTDTAAIGDVIDYKVDGTVPDYTGYDYYYYILNDTLSKGLTLSDEDGNALNAQVTVDGEQKTIGYGDLFTVKIGDDTLTYSENALTEDAENTKVYYVKAVTDDTTKETKFVLSIENIEQYEIGAAITIEYHALVNKDAETGLTANTNKATLQYSNNPNVSDRKDKTPGNDNPPGTPESKEQHPTGETTEKKTETYVTELELSKVDKDGNYVNALAGAEFTLYGDNLTQINFTTGTSFVKVADGETGTHYLLKDGTYTTEAPRTTDQTQADGTVLKANSSDYAETTANYKTVTVATATSAKIDENDQNTTSKVTATIVNGKIVFKGLNAGDYTLRETHTPDGYNTADDIKFTIGAELTDENKTFSWNIDKDKTEAEKSGVTMDKDGKFSISIKNLPGSTLPSTGGMGTTVVYIAGIAMIVIAGIVVIARKRMA